MRYIHGTALCSQKDKAIKRTMKSNCEFILFLDFDGVLHPLEYERQEVFSKSEYLKQFLECYQNMAVVVSSGWRRWYSLEQIKQMVPAWLAKRIKGVLPVIDEHPRRLDVPEELWCYPKQAEGYLWSLDQGLEECFENGRWVALDKNMSAYEENAIGMHVVFPNERKGLQEQDMRVLEEKVRHLMSQESTVS